MPALPDNKLASHLLLIMARRHRDNQGPIHKASCLPNKHLSSSSKARMGPHLALSNGAGLPSLRALHKWEVPLLASHHLAALPEVPRVDLLAQVRGSLLVRPAPLPQNIVRCTRIYSLLLD